MKKLFFIIALLAVLMPAGIKAQSYFEDTVWTKKTDQIDGFYMVKFSQTDSIIVGHGQKMDLFFDAFTGEEIIRIPGNDEVFFFNNDENFLRINNNRKVFEIFDTHTFQVIDTLENAGISITESPFADVSENGQYFISQIDKGFSIWNLMTKQIKMTKQFPEEENMISLTFSQVKYICNDSRIMGKIGKVYEDPEHPNNPEFYKRESYYIIFDAITLDSIDYFPYARTYRMTKNCQKIAIATASTDYGVEIYDFATKQLLRRLPVNGPSLTGIEFSPDDKYIVTSGHGIIIWDVMTGEQKHFYPGDWDGIHVSNNGKYIISCGSEDFWLWFSRFGQTNVPKNEDSSYHLIYPNPTTDYIDIAVADNRTLKGTVRVYNVPGVCVLTHPLAPSREGESVRFDVSGLAAGVYFVRVGGKMYKFVKL